MGWKEDLELYQTELHPPGLFQQNERILPPRRNTFGNLPVWRLSRLLAHAIFLTKKASREGTGERTDGMAEGGLRGWNLLLEGRDTLNGRRDEEYKCKQRSCLSISRGQRTKGVGELS